MISEQYSQHKSRLILRDVSKTYSVTHGDPVLAVSDVSFDVIESEVCVLLGPSGCGKSTILHMMAGLTAPTSGSLMLDSREIHSPGRDRGMVFQGYTSFPWLTVKENI